MGVSVWRLSPSVLERLQPCGRFFRLGEQKARNFNPSDFHLGRAGLVDVSETAEAAPIEGARGKVGRPAEAEIQE
jgi:hypothetical protein